MIRRWHSVWEAVLLLAVLLGGSAAYVSAQMTAARLPLQGVGVWGYDPNLGSFFSLRVDQDGTLIVSALAGGGLFSIVPGVGASSFFLVSIFPAGGVQGPGGSILVSQWSGGATSLISAALVREPVLVSAVGGLVSTWPANTTAPTN